MSEVSGVRATGILLCLVGAWLVVSGAALHYPATESANDLILRQGAVASAVILGALWLMTTSPSRKAAALCALAGLALLLCQALAPAIAPRIRISESLSAVLILALAGQYLFGGIDSWRGHRSVSAGSQVDDADSEP